MKKTFMVIICLFILLFGIDVYAKDSIYTLNKYSEEEYDFILKNKNSFVVAGTFLKTTLTEDDNEYLDYQVMLVKYNKNNQIKWKYNYGSNMSDSLYALNYHYDSELNIDGYVLVVDKTMDYQEHTTIKPMFIIIDDDGKNIGEVDTYLEEDSYVNNMIYTTNNEGIIDGYLLVGKCHDKSFIAKYDLSLNKIWNKDYTLDGVSTSIEEVEQVNDSYVMVLFDNNNNTYKISKFDNNGDFVKIIKEDFEKDDVPHIMKNDNKYIIYGYTDEVKLNKKSATSYYLIQYNENDEVDWDLIGDVNVNKKKLIKLISVYDKDTLIGFNLMYTNGNDNSIEVVKINVDGTIGNKIKKIKNNYYKINDFITKKDTIYFIGQIDCPDDDSCDYDSSCLFLVSDENKVIEVKDNDSKNILVIGGLIIVVIYLVVFYVKKRRN